MLDEVKVNKANLEQQHGFEILRKDQRIAELEGASSEKDDRIRKLKEEIEKYQEFRKGGSLSLREDAKKAESKQNKMNIDAVSEAFRDRARKGAAVLERRRKSVVEFDATKEELARIKALHLEERRCLEVENRELQQAVRASEIKLKQVEVAVKRNRNESLSASEKSLAEETSSVIIANDKGVSYMVSQIEEKGLDLIQSQKEVHELSERLRLLESETQRKEAEMNETVIQLAEEAWRKGTEHEQEVEGAPHDESHHESNPDIHLDPDPNRKAIRSL